MHNRFLIATAILGVFGYVLLSNSATNSIVSVWVSCDGTVVSRTDTGKLEVTKTEQNTPNCRGSKVKVTQPSQPATPTTTPVTSPDDTVEEVIEYIELPGGPTDTILLDLKQTDIVNYRLERMRQNQIRYANAIRSVRMRQAKSRESKTTGYLIKNESVMTDGTGSGWTQAQGINLEVTDAVENTIVADTTGKASGYVATKYLREANPSDLVRIHQADNAYWSDIAHVEVARYVNVRLHPWYGAPIVTVLTDDTPLYIVSTVDDWSEVISDDRKIRGFIKSKYLVVDKAQRVEQAPLIK